MAVTLSRNLKLRLDSNLTANARYNLERLDLLGSTFVVDTRDGLNIRSETDITIEPESADIGGSGIGGTINLGSASHELSELNIYAAELNISAPLSFVDQAVGGDKALLLQYKSDITGPVDTAANRTLSFDLEAGDRNLVLGGDLEFSGGDLTLTLSDDTSLTLPESGTLATLAGIETLTNKSISGASNTFSAIPGSAVLPDFVAQNIQTTGELRLSNGSFYSAFEASGSQASTVEYVLPASAPTANQVLRANSATPTNLEWATIAGSGSVSGFAATWAMSDGTTKVVTHNLASSDIDVSVIDLDDNSIVVVDSIVATTANSVTLTASEAPANNWRVVVQAN